MVQKEWHHPFTTGPWEHCPSPKSCEVQVDLPAGLRGERSQGSRTLGIQPSTRLRRAQLNCLDLTSPTAIFQRKGKNLRESYKMIKS